MSRPSGIARLVVLPTLTLAGAAAVSAADWSGSLEAGVNAAHATNPQMLPGVSLDDSSALLALDGSATAQGERGQLTVTPRFQTVRYQRATHLNTDTGSIDFASLQKLERGQWTVTAQALTDSTLTSELGQSGITAFNRRHDAGNLSLGYQHFSTERLSWQLTGTGQITRYSDAQPLGLTNYDYGSVQFGPSWGFSARLLGSLNLEAGRFKPQTGLAQNDYTASLKLQRDLSEQYAWRASAGMSRVESGSAVSASGPVYEVGASRHAERVQWDVMVRRSVAPIGVGTLARQEEAVLGVLIGTSEHSTLNLALHAIHTDPVTIVPGLVYSGASWGQVAAEWQYHLSRKWLLSAAYLQARARNGGWQQWANGNQARLGILWQSGRL